MNANNACHVQFSYIYSLVCQVPSIQKERERERERGRERDWDNPTSNGNQEGKGSRKQRKNIEQTSVKWKATMGSQSGTSFDFQNCFKHITR